MDKIIKLAQLSKYRPEGGHLSILFKLLDTGIVREEAKLEMNKMGVSKGNFDVLYSKLDKKLREGIFLNSFKDYSDFRKKISELLKELAACKIMIHNEDKLNGVPNSIKTIRKALKLRMPEIAFPLARELESHYSIVEFNKYKYKKYKELSLFLQQEVNRETEAQRLYAELAFLLNSKQPVEGFITKIQNLQDLGPSPNYLFNMYYFVTKNLYFRAIGDYEKLIQTCEKAFTFFDTFKSPLPDTLKWNFGRQTIPFLIQQGKFPEAENMASRCTKMVKKGSYNYHLSLMMMAMVGFHSNKPSISFEVIKLAKKSKMLFKSENINNWWTLIEAYHSLYDLNTTSNFKLSKFLNSVPKLTSDKKRNNVAVIIAQLLHLWKSGKRESFGERAIGLNSYINRYLRKPEFDRVRWLLLLMQKFYEAGYHPARYEPRAKKLLKKINNSSPLVTLNIFETEVIPISFALKILTKR